jgi:hypothetical protein
MTNTPTTSPCLFHPSLPCQNLKGYSLLCDHVPPGCEHLLKATLKPGDVEFFVMMDSNCHLSPTPCAKPDGPELRVIARWEAAPSRSNSKYKKLTYDLKSLQGDTVSFPKGHPEGASSVLPEAGTLWVYPDYPQANSPVCDNDSVLVERMPKSALRRVPVKVKVKVWKDENDPGSREHEMTIKVAVPAAVIDPSAPVNTPAAGKPGEASAPSPSATPEPYEVFISYAREDVEYKKTLVRYLSPLQDEGLIASWHDRDISAGMDWDSEIHKHLGDAKIILLLVSFDFMTSSYIKGKELKRALERHEAGDARVIPVIIRSFDWTGAKFAKLQALPPAGRPLSSYTDKDEWYTEVIKGLRRVAEEMRARSTSDD